MFRRWLLAVMATVLVVAPGVGATPLQQMAVCGKGVNNFFGIQPWYACLQEKYHGEVKIGALTDIFLIIFPLVESLIKISALVAAGMIFYLLFKIVYAKGDAGKIATARGGIVQAIAGFVICLFSIAIVNFVAGAFSV